MDPVANLAEQEHTATMIQRRRDRGLGDFDEPEDDQDVDRLVELVLALAEWRRKGGFMPAANA